MIARCPICQRETSDFVGGGDVLLCRRCADAVDVEQALQAAGKAAPATAAPPVRPRWRFPAVDRRVLYGTAAAAALLTGILIGWFLRRS
jgi:hypothetical protein